MSDEEKERRNWKALPARSGEAFAAARARALASGQNVLQSNEGIIYEVSPGGKMQEVKRIEPPIRVSKGKVITLR